MMRDDLKRTVAISFALIAFPVSALAQNNIDPTGDVPQTPAPKATSTPSRSMRPITSPRPHVQATARPAPATPSPIATATVVPAAPSTPAPSPLAPTPSPASSAAPATPSPYGYSFHPPVPPQDAPRILEIDMTDRIVRPGLMQVRVLADASVTSIIVRSMGHEFALPQQSSGVFMASNRVPSIPFFLRGRTFWVEFVASRQDGRQTVVSLPVVLN